jgi:hypothetical protein
LSDPVTDDEYCPKGTGVFGNYYYIYLCIILEQCSDQEESKLKGQKSSQNNVNDGVCQIK